MKKLLLALVAVGAVGAIVIGGQKSGDKQTIQEKPVVEIDPVDVARGACRSLVKDASKYRDTVTFKSITHQVAGDEVDVKLSWTADNKLGTPVRYESACILKDKKIVFFTVDDQVLIDKKA